MPIDAPQPRRKPVEVPQSADRASNLAMPDPAELHKFTIRVPMDLAAEVKAESFRRKVGLTELFQEMWTAYQEANGLAAVGE